MSKPNRNPAPDKGTPNTKTTTDQQSALDICRTCVNFGNSGCDCCGWYWPKPAEEANSPDGAEATKAKAQPGEEKPVNSRSEVRWGFMLFIFRQFAFLT